MSQPKVYDTIIGSGFGGSGSALRMSESVNKSGDTPSSSKPVLLLERGKDWWGNLTSNPLILGSTGACTPAWTIAALAEYCMENLAEELIAGGI